MSVILKVGDTVTRKRGNRGQVGIITKLFWCRWGPNIGRLYALVKWCGSGARRGNRTGGDRTIGVLAENLTHQQEPTP